MYEAYRVRNEDLYKGIFYGISEEFNKDKKDLVNLIVKEVSSPNGIRADELQELLFSRVEGSHVFLSHSFDDRDEALCVKEYIETNQPWCKVFIDSLCWQSVYDAQEVLEEQYGMDGITKNLYPMLCVALAQMIQACRSFVFLETKNSVSTIRSLDEWKIRGGRSDYDQYTQSSWIYYELQIAQLLLKQKKGRMRASQESIVESFGISFNYSVRDVLKGMQLVSLDSLLNKLRN